MSSVLDLMQSRYTTKHYDESAPRLSQDEMDRLLEVLRLAPSSINCQPWHFYVINTPEAIERIMPAVKDFNVNRMNTHDFIFFAIETDITDAYWNALYEQEKADGRYDKWTKPERPDANRRLLALDYTKTEADWYCYASCQVHLAVGCLMVACEEMGIDSTLLGGIEFDKLDDILDMRAKKQRFVLGIALGHRAKDDSNAARPKSRWPKERIVHYVK